MYVLEALLIPLPIEVYNNIIVHSLQSPPLNILPYIAPIVIITQWFTNCLSNQYNNKITGVILSIICVPYSIHTQSMCTITTYYYSWCTVMWKYGAAGSQDGEVTRPAGPWPNTCPATVLRRGLNPRSSVGIPNVANLASYVFITSLWACYKPLNTTTEGTIV